MSELPKRCSDRHVETRLSSYLQLIEDVQCTSREARHTVNNRDLATLRVDKLATPTAASRSGDDFVSMSAVVSTIEASLRRKEDLDAESHALQQTLLRCLETM